MVVLSGLNETSHESYLYVRKEIFIFLSPFKFLTHTLVTKHRLATTTSIQILLLEVLRNKGIFIMKDPKKQLNLNI